MPTLSTRTFSFKDTLSDAEVVEYWQFVLETVTLAIRAVPGVCSVKFYWGAGALRADLAALIEMDDAAAYKRLLLDPQVRKLLGRLYGAWDLKSAGQTLPPKVIPELIRALSSTGSTGMQSVPVQAEAGDVTSPASACICYLTPHW